MKKICLIAAGALMFICLVQPVFAQEDMGWPPPGNQDGQLRQNEERPLADTFQLVLIPVGVILIDNSGQQAFIFIGGPAKADSAEVAQDMKRGLRREVSLVLIRVSVLPGSRDSLVLHPDNKFGIYRDSRDIPALGIHKKLSVHSGDTAYTYIVFPRMEFRPQDVFYIKFRNIEIY